MQRGGWWTLTAGSGFSDIVAAEREYAREDMLEVGSMLSYDERLVLHWATRAGNPSSDPVVDAGCFLGGSTVALAGGVLARPEGRRRSDLHVYDLFVYGSETERPGSRTGFRSGWASRAFRRSSTRPAV